MGGSSNWSYWDYLPWELRSNVGESHMMATAEARKMWQRTGAKCHLGHEDAIRSPKAVKCSLPRIISRSQTDACGHPTGYSNYWSNNCFSPDTRLNLQEEFSPKARRDYDSEHDGSLNARFSKPAGLQSLAAESTSAMKSGPGLLGATCDCCTAELELEWQFIVDPRSKSGLTPSMSEEEDVAFEEAMLCDAEHNGPERLHQEPPREFGTMSGAISKNNSDVGSHGSGYGGFLSRQQLFASNVGAALHEMLEDQERISRSSPKSLLWQVAQQELLARQVMQNSVDFLDYCGVHCSQRRLATKTTTTGFECNSLTEQQHEALQNPDTDFFSSLTGGSESKHLESTGRVPSRPSPGLGRLTPNPSELCDSHSLSNPWAIPSINGIPTGQGLHSFSSSSRNVHFDGGGSVTLDQGSELFAEALCHSQTRAREAEKKVQQAFEEKERLMRLFFKEAYLAFTYRQWVNSLQSENMWLRMSPQHQPVPWLQHSVFNPFSAFERFSSKRWRTFGHNYPTQYHRGQHLSHVWPEKALVCLGDPNEIMVGYTLAFALGLSLAGAGLVLGWSMGWILL